MPASPPKRILFVSGTAYLPRAVSGANISLHALCERLRRLGHDPIVVCTPDADGPAAGEWQAPAYSVIRIAEPVEAMKEMLAVLAPDAVVVRGPWPAIRAVRWAATTPGLRLHVDFASVSFEHGFPAPNLTPGVRYAATSCFLSEICAAMLGCPVATVPAVIEPEAYRCMPAGDAILFVNPVPSKGAHLVAAIAERLPHRKFLIARSWASAPDEPLVEIALPNAEAVATVHDMRALYARARLVLMPSLLEESWGRVVTEAQFSGIPAVVNDRGALAENVGPGGIVLPPGAGVQRWCEAIESLLGDAARYEAASQAAIAHAARMEATPETAVARFLDFIAE